MGSKLDPVARTKMKLVRACDAMLNKLGTGHIPHALLFQILNERAHLKGFKIDGGDPTDLCFVSTGEVIQRDHIMNGRSTSTRYERRHPKRKYEAPITEDEASAT